MSFFNEEEVEGILNDGQTETMQTTLIEAVKRIEEANLWKTLMTTEVFQAGSARPEILTSVNHQIKEFAREKLEECVGIKSSQAKVNQTAQVFSEEEVNALKVLASRLIQKDPTMHLKSYSPAINVVQNTTEVKPASIKQPAVSDQIVKTNSSGASENALQTASAQPTKRRKVTPKPPGYIEQPKEYMPSNLNSQAFNLSSEGPSLDGLQNMINNAILKSR